MMILLRNDVPAVLRELVPSAWFLSRSSGVPEKPEINGLRKPAIEGDHITLTCITHGSKPAADLRWFRNEKEIKGESHLCGKLCLGCFLKHSGTKLLLRTVLNTFLMEQICLLTSGPILTQHTLCYRRAVQKSHRPDCTPNFQPAPSLFYLMNRPLCNCLIRRAGETAPEYWRAESQDMK